jgi:prefoldin subunit 5
MTNPIIVETDLKDILKKIDDRLERIEQKLEVLPKIETEITQLRADITDLKSNQRYQIWALIVLLMGAFVKFGFFPNP